MEVNQATFGRMAGVSRAAIGSKIKTGNLVLNSGGKLDTDHPLNRAYLDAHQSKMRESDPTSMGSMTPITSRPPITPKLDILGSGKPSATCVEENITQEMLQLTIRELVERYGSLQGIERWVKVLRDITTADEKNQRLEERRLQQIPKDFVVSRLFGYLNQLANKILDAPDTMADQVIALVRSDPENCRHKVVTYTRDVLSRTIGGAKEAVINELAGLRSKYDERDTSLEEKLEELMEDRHEQ